MSRDTTLIAFFAAEDGEAVPEWHKPARGRPVTTMRGRAAGAREARTWLSAAEYAEVEKRAEADGLTVSVWVRARLLGER